MPDLLLELYCEEIPARMQARAADHLRERVTAALVEAGLAYEGAKAFATPRRLALTVHGVPARSPDRRERLRVQPAVVEPPQLPEMLVCVNCRHCSQGILRCGASCVPDAE